MTEEGKRERTPEEVYCWNCGRAISKQAVICVHCGVKAKRGGGLSGGIAGEKSKTTAILLAVFLSYWTWLYTAKTDLLKFVIGIVGHLLGGVILAFVVDRLPHMGGPECFTIGFALSGTAVWIWAIVDRCVKPSEWYADYPGN